MAAPGNLKEVYLDEMQDLWSANDQMVRAVQQLSGKANDPKLRQMLEQAVGGIQKHTDALKNLIQANGGEAKPEHCKGMEGLVAEALKHGVQEAPSDGRLRDVQIIAQYQRMTHYGLAGFVTAVAYAKSLGRTDDAANLKQAVSEIYKGDAIATHLAEAVEKAAA